MQMISEIMTRNVRFVAPQENLQHAAQLMDELNIGVLPVCEGDRLIGMITDRDITVRATAAGIVPDDALVQEVMTRDVRWCFEDQSVDEVLQQMGDTQVRRVPVVTHDDDHRLIGIVALGDIATKAGDGENAGAVAQVVEQVSTPSTPEPAASGSNFAPSEGLSAGSATGESTLDGGSDDRIGTADIAAAPADPQNRDDMLGDSLSGSAVGVDGTLGGSADADAVPNEGIAAALDAMPGAPSDVMTGDGTGGDVDAGGAADATDVGASLGAASISDTTAAGSAGAGADSAAAGPDDGGADTAAAGATSAAVDEAGSSFGDVDMAATGATGGETGSGTGTGAATGGEAGGGTELMSPADQEAVAKVAAALDPKQHAPDHETPKAPADGSAT